MILLFLASLSGLFIWICILLLPWHPWGTQENIDADQELSSDLSEVTVLIPARNESRHISQTLKALTRQGQGLSIILVDDQSTDDTAEIAAQAGIENLTIIHGVTPEPVWSGKLWALEQGFKHVRTNYVLLLDADISLVPGLISTLLTQMHQEKL